MADSDKGLYSLSESPSKEPSAYKEYKVAEDLPQVPSPPLSPDPPPNPPPLLKKLMPRKPK